MEQKERKMKIDREKAKKTFAEYVNRYDATDTKTSLKILHTYKVCELCERIAKDQNLPEEDVDIAWLMGLLHDIGRFEQLRRFGTFQDSISINHAHFGADILFQDGVIREYLEDTKEDNLLQTAIWYHSAYRLPEELSERKRLFCNILRDADKIDILRVNVEVPLEEIYNTTTEDLKNAVITEEVMQAFHELHCIDRSLKKASVDNVIGHISLVFELVFPISFRIVMEQGYLKQLMEFHSENPIAARQFEDVKNTVQQFIASKSL